MELFKYCLRLADTNLILGQRLAEWCGHGPFLEEDLALTNISLDLVGQARSLYEYAALIEDKGRTEDDIAFFRNDREFYNILLAEVSNGDFAMTIARQFLIDVFQYYFYQELSRSKDETLSAIAHKSNKEIAYHLRHSASWMKRLGDGTDESHQRLQNAINELWRFTGDMFDMDEVDELLIEKEIAVDLMQVNIKWKKHIEEIFEESTLSFPETKWMQKGSKKGIHTEQLSYILAEMQALPRMLPDAKW